MVCGGAKTEEDLRSVGGAILALLDQTVVLLGLSSSAEEGGGRSPYNPPSISTRVALENPSEIEFFFLHCQSSSSSIIIRETKSWEIFH